MIYLEWYLGIGVAVLLVVFISHKLSKKNEPNIMDMLESVNPDRDKWHYKLLNNYVAPLLAALVMPFVWPLMIWWKVKEIIDKRNVPPTPEEKVFAVVRENLVSRTSIEEVESRELVIDPMNAVPAAPFGFLNAAWGRFKSQILPGDEIWSFVADWDEWRDTQRRHGYAILRANAVPHWFMTGWDNIEIPPPPPEPEPTFEELERKLTAWNWEVRWCVIYEKHKLTPAQVDRAQKDRKRLVRFAVAKRFDLTLTPKQIEKGLRDRDEDVREIYSYREDYALTDEQIERGLTDKSSMIRMRIQGRYDLAGRLTAAQIERGLTDGDRYVRSSFAGRSDFVPTPTQVERGLTDSYDGVRSTFARHKDLTLTAKQIERGLADESEDVREVFQELAAPSP